MRRAVEAARAWGVAPSVLAGRMPRPGEPAWTQDDADLAVALMEIEADTCPGCGWDRGVSMDAANELAFEAEPVRCHACATRDRVARKSGDGWDDAGISWMTTRKG